MSSEDSREIDKLLRSDFYVDKTLFVKEFMLMKRANALVTTPHFWGKSSILYILKNFLQIEDGSISDDHDDQTMGCLLLETRNFSIARDKEFFATHCGKHPVIHVVLRVKHVVGSFDKFLGKMRQDVYEVFSKHDFLEESTALNEEEKTMYTQYTDSKYYLNLTQGLLERGLQFLSKILYKHFNKRVIVLIDELDRPLYEIIDSLKNVTYPEKTISVIKNIYSNLLKDNPYVDRSLIFNYMELSEMLLSGVELTRYPFLGNHRWVEYFGLTEQEVKGILKEKGNLKMYGEVEEFYGYQVPGTDRKMFNPWSIVSYVDYNDFDSYWIQGAGLINLQVFFLNEGIRKYLGPLVHWDEITLDDYRLSPETEVMVLHNCFKSIDDRFKSIDNPIPFNKTEGEVYLKFLLDNGYMISERKNKKQIRLYLPNKEIQEDWYYLLYYYVCDEHRFHSNKTSVVLEAISALGVGKERTELLQDLVESLNNLFRNVTLPVYGDVFQAHLYFMMYESSRFKRTRAEDGRVINGTRAYADILAVRKCDKTGIIIETKYRKQSAEEALQQILDKGYYRLFDLMSVYKNKIKGDRIYVGLHMDKHNRISACYLVNSLFMKSKTCVELLYV